MTKTVQVALVEDSDTMYSFVALTSLQVFDPGVAVTAPWVYRDVNADFGVTTKPSIIYDEQAVQGKMLNLFRCPRGTRLHRPTFGSDLFRLIHEPCDHYTADKIFTDLFEAIKEWIPEVDIDMGRSSVTPLDSRTGFSVYLTYSIPKLKVTGSFNFDALKT